LDFTILSITSIQLNKILKNVVLMDTWFFQASEDDGPRHPVRHEYLSLGRGWHGLHFLINRTKWSDEGTPPGCYSVLGKHFIEEANTLNITCSFLFPEEVSQVYQYLKNLNRNELKRNFNSTLMNKMEIYPTWSKNDFDILYETFEELVQFYRMVARKKKCTLNILFY